MDHLSSRLDAQRKEVWELMKDGEWRTLDEIQHQLGYPTQSISARLRDFRKTEHGGHAVERRGTSTRGLYLYRVIPSATQAA